MFAGKEHPGPVKETIHITTDLGESFDATLTAYATVLPPANEVPATETPADRRPASPRRPKTVPPPLAARLQRNSCHQPLTRPTAGSHSLAAQLALTPRARPAIIPPLFSGLRSRPEPPILFYFRLRSISLETRVLRLALRIARCHYGRALVAWCVVLAAALVATAQFPAVDGPPLGMDPDRESQFEGEAQFGAEESIITTDDGGEEVDGRR